ncbi:MAG: radical SAM family heme chaperone HemW [Pseudomonadota bacterium]
MDTSPKRDDRFGLYVHLPWCLAKCPYCDFNSHLLKPGASLDGYVTALEHDLARTSKTLPSRVLGSVFLGGGTPSVFSPRHIEQILSAVSERFRVARDAEITMEANPGSLGEGGPAEHALADYRAAGVNRLSLGAQSFSAESLTRLGRIHGPHEIHAAYAEARSAGFDNINLDIMFGLPGQSVADAERDVDAAVALEPDHLSYYELTLEPNTVFHAHPPEDLPDDDAMAVIQDAGLSRLSRAGYRRYEVSAFAKPESECRHNLNYWLFGDYLGVGAGAHGKWRDADGVTWRSRKTAHPHAYVTAARQSDAVEPGDGVEECWTVDGEDLEFEFALNALRLTAGFTNEQFTTRTGLPAMRVTQILRQAESDGLVVRSTDGGWAASSLGQRYLNDLQARFLPSPRRGDRAG